MKGIIYKLSSPKTDKVYIGSTKNKYISARINHHKFEYRRYLENKMIYKGSFEILKYEDFKVEVLEEVECETLKDLRIIEHSYMEKFDNLSNLRGAYLHNDVKKERKKISDANYRNKNKEKLSKINKDRYHSNKEEINAKRKIYRDNNKEKLKQMSKVRANCEYCGKELNKNKIPRHQRDNCKSLKNK